MTDRRLAGAFDTHVHAAPDIVDRIDDFAGVARKAAAAGMAGLVFKDLSGDTTDRAHAVNQMDLGLRAFGGVVLDLPVGGINPIAVERSLKKGARVVWMPVAHSRNTLDRFETGTLNLVIPPEVDRSQALTILTSGGELTADTVAIVELVASHDAVLASGHLAVEETKALFTFAAGLGVRRLLVNHPCGLSIGASIRDQQELSAVGALMEHCYAQTTAGLDNLPIQTVSDAIREVGPERCLVSTDLGQIFNPTHVDGLARYINELEEQGISLDQLRLMTTTNPAQLLTWG